MHILLSLKIMFELKMGKTGVIGRRGWKVTKIHKEEWYVQQKDKFFKRGKLKSSGISN